MSDTPYDAIVGTMEACAALLQKQYCQWDLAPDQVDDLLTNDFELASSELFQEGMAQAPALVGYAVRLAAAAIPHVTTIEHMVKNAWRIMHDLNASVHKRAPWLAVPSRGVWASSVAESEAMQLSCVT